MSEYDQIKEWKDKTDKQQFLKKTEEFRSKIERLQSELVAEKEKNRWIPVSDIPNHHNSVLFADFKSAAVYECGIPAAVGFFCDGEIHLPTGCGISPTDYKDCIQDEETRTSSRVTPLPLEEENKELRIAVQLLLDQVDYTTGNCRINEMVGAVLPSEIINRAKEALK